MPDPKTIGEVLIIDDNDDDYEATERALRQDCTYSFSLRRFGDGATAWQYLTAIQQAEPTLRSRLPSLIILDLNMPGMDGRHLLDRLKQHSHLRRIPVIVMTTSTEENDIRACYQSGANTFVAKPLSYDDFLATVARLRDFWFEAAALAR